MEIVVALIGAAATIVAALITVRATRPATEGARPAETAGTATSGPVQHSQPTAPEPRGGVSLRLCGAFGAFLLSALAFATVLNTAHDLSTGAGNAAAAVVGIVVLVMTTAVLWNLARLLVRPIGASSPVRRTFLLAVNVVTFGVVLAMMAGQW